MAVGILVRPHALERARERYGLVNIDVRLIRDDVRDALVARRAAKQLPHRAHVAEGNSVYVWTPRMERIYVVAGQRGPTRAWLCVLTALPSAWRDDIDEWEAAA